MPRLDHHVREAGRLGTPARLIWWLIAGLSLWLRSGFATVAFGEAGLDDFLFIRLARNLGAGLWLGPFDNTTLVKGMAYPLFILLSFVAGIPLKLAEQGVYLAASAGTSLLLVRSNRSPWLATALFAALAFNPVLWTPELSRVIREGLYVGLSLAVVVLAAATILSSRPTGVGRWVRGLALGVAGAVWWLTREEGVWLFPALATVLLLGSVAPGRIARSAPLVPATLTAATLIGGVMLLNSRYYGAAETVEVKSAAFEHAYGALSRIEHRQWQRFVVFPSDARALAYQVSPAARELAPSLDGKAGQRWVEIGCAASPMPDCSEIQASWFQWALRDAVKDAGHYGSAADAAQYYRQLATEIDQACDRREIPCLPARASLAPPFRWHYLEDAAGAAIKLARILLRPGATPAELQPSQGLGIAVDLFAEMTGPVQRDVHSWLIVDATVGSPLGAPMLSVQQPDGLAVRSEFMADPVVDGQAPPYHLRRVRFVTDCPPSRCELMLQTDAHVVPLGRLDALPASIREPDAYADIHTVTHLGGQSAAKRAAFLGGIARRIGSVYAVVTPVLAVTGGLGLLLALLLGGRATFHSPIVVLAAASLVAVICRVALLAYLDVTAIASANVLYASPASPFVIVFAVLGTALLVATAAGRVR